MTRPIREVSEEVRQFVHELKAAGIERKAIVREAQKRYPDQQVTRWQVEVALYPKIAERLARERAANQALRADARRRQALVKAEAPQPPRHRITRRPVSESVPVAEMLEGVPELARLLDWIERAKRLMPGDPEPAFDIATALRRLDLVERTHAYRITTQAGQPAIQ